MDPAGIPSRRARATASSCIASARPARVAGSEGIPRARSGATTSGPAGTRIRVPARARSRWANAWSASARSGSTRPVITSRIGSASTRSIRSNAATTAWSGAARVCVVGHQPDVASTARARLVDEPPQDRERPLRADGHGLGERVVGVEAAAGRRGRVPASRSSGRRASTRSASSRLGGTSTRMTSTPASIARRASSSASTIAGDARVVADPRPRRVAEQRDQLATCGPVGIDALHRGPREARGVGERRRRAGPARRGAPPRARGPRARPPPRAPAPAARRSYSAMAIANGRAMPPPSRRGSGPRYRLTTSAASGRPARSSPPRRTGAGSPAPGRRS